MCRIFKSEEMGREKKNWLLNLLLIPWFNSQAEVAQETREGEFPD